MKLRRSTHILLCAVIGMASAALVRAQGLPAEPRHDIGQNVTAAFEGWFKNQDGTFSILFGYYNRNQKQELEIPVGPNNRIEPGGPDQGQPTHFLPGRQWGVFTVTVPKDFGASNKVTWTLISNGQTTAIPGSLNPLWEINAYHEPTTGNNPPVIRFAEGKTVQGPRPISTVLSASVGKPRSLSVSVSDDATMPLIGTTGMDQPKTPPVTVTWSKFRGPGAVAFTEEKPSVELAKGGAGSGVSGSASTSATFSEPGDYVLLVVANDWSGVGGHGYQCCWTNALVKVSVKP